MSDVIEKLNDLEQMMVNEKARNFFAKNQKGEWRFAPLGFFNEVIKTHRFIKVMGERELYYYKEGIWKTGGNEIIQGILSEALGDDYRSHYGSEAVNFIQGKCLMNGGFEENKNLICLENGVLNIDTKEVTPWSPDYHLTVKLPVRYNPQADCPSIKKFLIEIMGIEDVPNVEELVGYCLFRDMPIHRAFLLVGEGANGKSTLINLIKTFLGSENIASISLQSLGKDRFAKAGLMNKLANLFADLPGTAVYQTGTFKILTGNDIVGAEKKFGGYTNFTNYAKFLFSCNKVPDVADDTGAYFRRWILVNFPNKFEQEKADKKLLQKLTTLEELSGLLNLALAGLKRLLEKGEFSNTQSTKEMQQRYLRLASPVKAFVMDCLETATDSTVPKEEMYRQYALYTHKSNLPTLVDSNFAKEFKRAFQPLWEERPTILGKRTLCWRGVKFKEVETEEKLPSQGEAIDDDKFVENMN